MTALALDTSVAIALLVQTHSEHAAIVRWWAGRDIALCGHAVAETYSVLTRLPGDLRLAPADAARLIAERFADPVILGPKVAGHLPHQDQDHRRADQSSPDHRRRVPPRVELPHHPVSHSGVSP